MGFAILREAKLNLANALKHMKKEIETTITSSRYNGKKKRNGQEAKIALIRSQKLINIIHEYIKEQLIAAGINRNKIHPPKGQSKPELKITGELKKKDQDVCITPSELTASQIRKIRSKKIEDTSDIKDNDFFEKTLVINGRSQLSSLEKNVDTLFERTFAEPLNLHLRYSKMVMGEIYLVPVIGYDEKLAEKNKVAFKENSKINKYIRFMQSLNCRQHKNDEFYKYERICLMIVDFKRKQPKLYVTIEDLKKDRLIDKKSKMSLENLTINGFVEDLLRAVLC